MTNQSPAPSPVGSTQCEKCKWWQTPEKDRGYEEFVYWLCIYDINKARRMLKDTTREVHELPTEQLAAYVNYPASMMIDLVKATIDENHIDHVDDTPIILAWTPKPRGDDNPKRLALPIDGHHRIAKAIKHNQPTVKCYLLTEEETDSIITDRRPPLRKTKAKKKGKS